MRAILLLLLCAAPLRAQDSASDLIRLRFEWEDRIVAGVLDPIFGEGHAFAFLDFSLEVAREENANEKSGRGSAVKERRKSEGLPLSAGDAEDALMAPDPDDAQDPPEQPKRPAEPANPGATVVASESRQGQHSRQTKTQLESRSTLRAGLKDLRVVVLHHPADPKRLAAAREALLAVFSGALEPGRLSFKSLPELEAD